jgi:hypothetical protein
VSCSLLATRRPTPAPGPCPGCRPAAPTTTPRTPRSPWLAGRRQAVDVDAGPGDPGEDLVGGRLVGLEQVADDTVFGEGQQGGLRDGVDRGWGGQPSQIIGVRQAGIFGRGAGPQHLLGQRPARRQATPAVGGEQPAVGGIGLLGGGDAELGPQLAGQPRVGRGVPAGHEHRGDRPHRQGQALGQAALNASKVGLGRVQVLGGGEQQGDVDRDAGRDQRLDGDRPRAGPRHLDHEVGPVRRGEQGAAGSDAALGVVGQLGGDFHRHIPIGAAGRIEDRPQQVSGGAQVLEGQREHEVLCGFRAQAEAGPDGVVVVGAAGDGPLEDGGVGGHAADRVLADVAGQGPGGEEVLADVVQPQTLWPAWCSCRRAFTGLSRVE